MCSVSLNSVAFHFVLIYFLIVIIFNENQIIEVHQFINQILVSFISHIYVHCIFDWVLRRTNTVKVLCQN